MLELQHSGIWELNGFRYLFQPQCPDGWNFVGLKTPSGYTTRHLKNCTHAIPPILTNRPVSKVLWGLFQDYLTDPLVNAMLPIPKKAKEGTGIYLLNTKDLPNHLEWLACLDRMSSPVHQSVRGWWTCRPSALIKELSYTNLQPLVITNLKQKDLMEVRKIVAEAKTLPRTLILVADEELILDPAVTQITTNLGEKSLSSAIALPFEHFGANVVLNYCRFQSVSQSIAA